MSLIVPTTVSAVGATVVNTTTMAATSTLTYERDLNPVLILRNGTAGPLTVNIRGNNANSATVSGIGPVSLTGGFSTGAIAAGATVAIPLRTIERWLEGTVVNLTGGTGISAQLIHSV